jgi:hypothetical protein
VGTYRGANLLYHNQGDGTFSEVLSAAGLDSSNDSSFGMVLEDFDNDGFLDVYVPKFQLEPVVGPSEIFLNNGDGTFRDVTAQCGLTGQLDMGHSTGDLDGDGFPDVYVGTGHPTCLHDDILWLVRPDGGGALDVSDYSQASGLLGVGPTRCHGMALGDYDQDGMVDVYVAYGGPAWSPGTEEPNSLWQAQPNGSRWTALALEGVLSNRTAVGASLKAVTDTGREVWRYLRVGHGFANTNSPIQHFGIGQDQSVERIEITWPSGLTQTLVEPAMAGITEVTETGMRVQGRPQVGQRLDFEFYGPPDKTLVVIAGFSRLDSPARVGAGLLEVGPPYFFIPGLELPASGKLKLPFDLDRDELSGVRAWFQVLVKRGGPAFLTDVVSLEIE